MKNVIVIIIGIMLVNKAFGTSQKRDILIYKNDTIKLDATLLELLYNKDNPRPENFFKIDGCWNTACDRGYQATWKIMDNKLYLIEIADCCDGDEYYVDDDVIDYLRDKLQPKLLEKIKDLRGYHLDWHFQDKLEKILGKKEYQKNQEIILEASIRPRQKADLNELFGKYCKDGKVFAFWLNGDLFLPKGKRFGRMGYNMSQYEKELVLSFEKGILVNEIEYESKSQEIENGFGILNVILFSIVVPVELVPNKNRYFFREVKFLPNEYYSTKDELVPDEDEYFSIKTDTISFFNASKTSSIKVFLKFNEERKTNVTKKILVEETIDILSKYLSVDFKFSNKTTEKLKFGTASWIDGVSNDKKERLRIFTMSNIRSQVIIHYKEKGINENDFVKKADYITYSVTLMQFFY